MRIAKLVLWGLIAILLLTVSGVGLFVSTFDPNSYRELLGKSIEEATGRKLIIDGELSLSVWPQIALRAEGVSLANPDGFATHQPMLRTSALEATIEVAPLLQREMNIDGVVFYSPVLLLQQMADGTNNWSDLHERFDKPTSESAAPLAVTLTTVSLRDATVSLQQPDSLLRATTLDMDAHFVASNSITLTTEGAWHTDAATHPAIFSLKTAINLGERQILLTGVALESALPSSPLSTQFSAPPRNQQEDILTLTTAKIEIDADLTNARIEQGNIKLANSNFSVNAALTNLPDAIQLTTNLSANGADTAALLAWAGVELPQSLPATRLGPLDLTATLTASLGDASEGSIQIPRFSAGLTRLQLKTDGALRLTSSGSARGTLNMLAPIDLHALTQALPEMFATDLFFAADSTGTAFAKPTLQSLRTDFRWTPALGSTPAQLDFSNTHFNALGITGSATGTTDMTDSSVTTRTAATLAEFSPKQVLTYFSEPISTEDPNAFSTASGTLSLLQDATGTHLTQLNIALDESQLRGKISVLDAPVLTLRFDATLDTLNATGYLTPSVTADRNPNATMISTQDTDLLGDMVLPTELLHRYDLSGSFRINQLQLYDLLLGDAGGRITLGNGQATLNNLSARLYGGSFIGKVGFTEDSDGLPELSVTGDLQRVAVQSLLQALSNTQAFSGRGNVQINMTGRGKTALEAVQSAGGKLGLRMEKGRYSGINIGHELCRLYNGLRNKPAPPAPEDTNTVFDSFSATANVLNGKAQTNDLLASNSYFKLSGTGLAQLARQSIDYNLDIELTGPIEITHCETLTPYIGRRIPVRLTGTFANPKLRPDFGKLVQREIVRRVEDKLTEKLFDLLGGKKAEPDNPTPPEN